MRILLVDDNQDILILMKSKLHDLDHIVYTAPDSLCAFVEVVKNPLIDLVITDLNMPGADGYELARVIKEIRNIPIILHTAKLNAHPSPNIYGIAPKGDIGAISRLIREIKAYQEELAW